MWVKTYAALVPKLYASVSSGSQNVQEPDHCFQLLISERVQVIV